MSVLEEIGVKPDYRHSSKLVRPEARLTLGEVLLKWYDIAPAEAPVPLAVRALARRNLRDGAKSGTLALSGELGFVILHRCGESFYFLIACSWRNDNELWQTVWAKHDDADPSFRPWVVEDGHRPTFCVWELGVVAHERLAWAAYLATERDAAARRTYLGDVFEGPV